MLNIFRIIIFFFSISLCAFSEVKNEEFLEENVQLISTYDNKLPEGITFNSKYSLYPGIVDYVYVISRVANLREKPDSNSKIIAKYNYDTKLKLLKKIKYKENYWYFVEDSQGRRGYMASSISKKRNFRFQMAYDKVIDLENFINDSIDNGYAMASTNSYVPNPENINFKRDKDKYGTTLDQNLLGYHGNEKIIIPDRSVVKILEDRGNRVLVKALSIPEELEIPKSGLTYSPKIKKGFKKVIAIDLQNQNFMVFEKIDDEWQLISYVYTKTGIDSKLGFETPKGYFSVPTVKYVMDYTGEDGKKEGSARYAIRFCGGGYLHGTPINLQEEVNREFFMKQKEFTLGTATGTRKCVRTTEEHAKFLFDWLVKDPNHSSNAQRPSEDAYVIVF